ncbi:MAG: hypothetical protein KBA29_01085 [Moraxellaceae bacterium]|nr:hypothetical protein [Moraxellaceae bacterium]
MTNPISNEEQISVEAGDAVRFGHLVQARRHANYLTRHRVLAKMRAYFRLHSSVG